MGTRFVRGARDGKTHLAAGEVGQAAHRVDGFKGGAGAHQHLLAREHLGLEEADQVVQKLVGLQHAAVPGFTTGLIARAHVEHGGAVSAQLLDVALRGRVRPHFAVHGGGQDQRHALDGARQAHQREQFVGPAVHQLGHEIGAGRGYHDRIGLAAEVDVRHVVVGATRGARVPLRGEDRAARERLHRHRGHELLGRLGHDHLHRGTLFHQRPAQLGRFVAGNAAREAQDDVFSSEFVHGRNVAVGPCPHGQPGGGGGRHL
ncbi:hypothetical protein FQZ97_897680 [compost metagenome]